MNDVCESWPLSLSLQMILVAVFSQTGFFDYFAVKVQVYQVKQRMITLSLSFFSLSSSLPSQFL